MGLFEKAGRRFEQFKRAATEAADEEADYECADCGTPVFAERDRCPECGSEEVVAREGGADAPDPDGTDDATSPGDGER